MKDGTDSRKGADYVQHVVWRRKETPVQPEKAAPAPSAPKQEEPAAREQHQSFASLVQACLRSLKKD